MVAKSQEWLNPTEEKLMPYASEQQVPWALFLLFVHHSWIEAKGFNLGRKKKRKLKETPEKKRMHSKLSITHANPSKTALFPVLPHRDFCKVGFSARPKLRFKLVVQSLGDRWRLRDIDTRESSCFCIFCMNYVLLLGFCFVFRFCMFKGRVLDWNQLLGRSDIQ